MSEWEQEGGEVVVGQCGEVVVGQCRAVRGGVIGLCWPQELIKTGVSLSHVGEFLTPISTESSSRNLSAKVQVIAPDLLWTTELSWCKYVTAGNCPKQR